MDTPRSATGRTLERHTVQTPDGWRLSLTRVVEPGRSPGPPVLFVPGYGMNAWVLQYHPSGRSFADVLLEHGFDPWGIDLRGTATSRGPTPAGLEGQALHDLPAALAYIRGVAAAEQVHAIGCSLGGSLLFAHAALADEHHLDRLVAIGAPLSWGRTIKTRVLGRVLQTAGQVPMRRTRSLARVALPIVARTAPAALGIYLNPRITDVSCAADLTRVVEDPLPTINRAVGDWMRGELRIGGRAIASSLEGFERPLMVVHGSGDGIVPTDAALSVVGAVGGPVEVVAVHHPAGEPVGHADMFVSRIAPREVFEPVARFLSDDPAA